MSSGYYNTPYSLNLKLKNLNNYTSTKNDDINILYTDLNNSIPSITNHLWFLKKKTRELNKSLNGIPVIYKNCHTSRENYKRYSSIKKKLPNISSSHYNYKYSYASPKPVLKQYKSNNISHHNNNLLYYKYSNNCKFHNLKYHKNKLNYDSIVNNPINLNRNYSKINTNRNNYKYNNNLNKLCVSYIKNDNVNNINRFNRSCEFANNFLYKRQFTKLKEQLGEKDKIINKMRGLINDTLEQLNLKNKENSLLQSELSELKAKKIFKIKMKNNYPINNKKNKINENKEYNNNYQKENVKKNNNYENKRYNNNLKEIVKKKKNKKNYNLNSQKNSNRNTYYNNNYNIFDNDNLGNKWEEIRKLNKKMENIILQNENNLEKYEKIRRKYNEY